MRGGSVGAARGGKASQPSMDKPKREAILDLSKYVNERVRVKFTGGREGQCNVILTSSPSQHTHTVTGVLKGFDQLLNLVLDDVVEQLQTGASTLHWGVIPTSDLIRRIRAINTKPRPCRPSRTNNHIIEPRRWIRRNCKSFPCPRSLRLDLPTVVVHCLITMPANGLYYHLGMNTKVCYFEVTVQEHCNRYKTSQEGYVVASLHRAQQREI